MTPRGKLAFALSGTFACLLALPAQAQDAPPTDVPRADAPDDARKQRRKKLGTKRPRNPNARPKRRVSKERAARRKKLLERYKAMTPEQRQEIQRRYREDLKNRSPEERKRLRKELQRLKKVRRQEKLKAKQKRFRKLPPEQRKRYRKLVKQVIRKLPPERRQALAELDPFQRQKKIKALLVEHRRRVLEGKLAKLPAEVRALADVSLKGLQGKHRFRQLNKVVDGFVRKRVHEVMRNPDLTPEQKHKRLRRLVHRHMPPGPRREARLKKMAERARKARNRRDGRPGVDRPNRPDADRRHNGRRRQGQGADRQRDRARPNGTHKRQTDSPRRQ